MAPLRALSLLAVYLPTALAECKKYCPYQTQPMEEKCGWAGCGTCDYCLPCMPHCPFATRPWEEKCDWAGCNGCAECSPPAPPELDPELLEQYGKLKQAGLTQVKAEMEALVASGASKGGVLVAGNVFTGEQEVLTAGEASPGVPMHADTVFQLASMTKMILGLVVAKLIEEGLTSMSSTPATVLPFLSYTAKYYDEAMSIQTFDMTTLTVRDFLGFKSGLFLCLLYDVDFIGFARANFGAYPGTPAEDAHCAQVHAKENSTGFGTNEFYRVHKFYLGKLGAPPQSESPSQSYLEMFKEQDLILPHRPGTKAMYGSDLDVLSAYVGKLLEAEGTTFAEWFTDRFLDPMGLTGRVFLGRSGMEVPAFVTDNLAGLFNTRNLYFEGADPSCDYSAGAVWVSDCPSEWTNHFETQTVVPSSVKYHTWGTGAPAGGAMSLPDYAKFLELLATKGMCKGKRIIGMSAMMDSMQAVTSTDEPLYMLVTGFVGLVPKQHVWTGLGAAKALADSPAGHVYPDIGGCGYQWAGAFGTSFHVDICTGFYMAVGQQAITTSENDVTMRDTYAAAFLSPGSALWKAKLV